MKHEEGCVKRADHLGRCRVPAPAPKPKPKPAPKPEAESVEE